MVSPEPPSTPRLSFSADFLDDTFISVLSNDKETTTTPPRSDFEFLSGDITDMITADELFSDGKMLPFSLSKISLKTDADTPTESDHNRLDSRHDERRISFFLDDDPSPRPPTCTVLWKELLRLKKPRPSTLSPSSSSSSSSSSEGVEERKRRVVSRVKRGLERTRSVNIRIRPMINVPICTAARSAALPPLFPARKGRLDS